MGRKGRVILAVACFLAAFLAWMRPAGATLGGQADSIEEDRRVLAASRVTVRPQNGYSIHEYSQDGTDIREYISPSGIVFGIAWNGMTHPDLAQLLGSYYVKYTGALARTPRPVGQRRLMVKENDVVVEKWGHMRNLQGRTYAPGLLPPGVTLDDIK